MKAAPGAVKSVMTGATLASLLLLGAGSAAAREGRNADALLTRNLNYQSARPELGPSVGACWNRPSVLVATSARSWEMAMAKMQDNLCVLPAPAAPKEDWARTGLLMVAYGLGEGSPSMRADVVGVSRSGNKLTVDVSLSSRVDGCGYCGQDEIRLSRRDLAKVNTVVVRYTETSAGTSAQTYAVGPDGGVGTGDPADQLASWGSLKAMYR